jgi:hypothetical protein
MSNTAPATNPNPFDGFSSLTSDAAQGRLLQIFELSFSDADTNIKDIFSDTDTKLTNNCYKYLTYISLLLKIVQTDQDDVNLITSIRDEFKNFIKNYRDLEKLYTWLNSEPRPDITLHMINTFSLSGLTTSSTLITNILIPISTIINSISETLQKMFDEYKTRLEKRTSSIVYLYYPDPDQEDGKIREDIVKYFHGDQECRKNMNCMMNDTITKTEDYLKVAIKTYNGDDIVPITTKEISTAIYDDNNQPKAIIYDDNNVYSEKRIPTSRGGRKNVSRKNKKRK